MTCIVGITQRGKVTIGGDSAAVSGHDISVRKDRKVFRNGPYVIGFTASFRVGQLLEHSFRPSPPRRGVTLERFMVTTFVDQLRECLQEGGVAEKHDDAEQGGTFLVGVKGRLFSIESDYQVEEVVDGFNACGCGESYAKGALKALPDYLTPESRIRKALEIAEYFSGAVRAPFHIVSEA